MTASRDKINTAISFPGDNYNLVLKKILAQIFYCHFHYLATYLSFIIDLLEPQNVIIDETFEWKFRKLKTVSL